MGIFTTLLLLSELFVSYRRSNASLLLNNPVLIYLPNNYLEERIQLFHLLLQIHTQSIWFLDLPSVMSMYTVICLKHVCDGQVVCFVEIHELIYFISDPSPKFSDDMWSCFTFYLCMSVIDGYPMPVIDSCQHVLFRCVINFFLNPWIKTFNFILFSSVKWEREKKRGEKNRKRTYTVVYHCLCCEVARVLSSAVSQPPNRKKCELPWGSKFFTEVIHYI